jgi:UPF0271 protein
MVARMTTQSITVNSDMGEGFGLHSFGNDEALMPLLDLANVACGFHAGDPQVMQETVRLAAEHGVAVGAHPGLPDLVGFGRRRMAMSPDEVENIVLYQTGALVAYLERAGLPLSHIKPHGALFGMVATDEALMRAAVTVARLYDVPFVSPATPMHARVCEEAGVTYIGELYVDMDYNPDGSLALARHAQVTDPAAAAERVRTALRGEPIAAVDGTPVTIPFTSVCVHSDAPTAVEVARAVRDVVGPRA